MSLDVRSTVGSGEDVTGWAILRRGFALSPALRDGLGVTLFLGAVSTIGSAIVPVVIQKTIDDGLLGSGGIDRADREPYFRIIFATACHASVCPTMFPNW